MANGKGRRRLVKRGRARARKGAKIRLRAAREKDCKKRIPQGCENRSPQKYEQWGKHELPIKRWCDISDHIKELLNAELMQITVFIKERTDLPPSLEKYEVGEFQFLLQGERKKETRELQPKKKEKAPKEDMQVSEFREVKEKRFKQSQEEALHHYRLFAEVVKEASKKKYEAAIEEVDKARFEEIKKWIESWTVPFPSRKLTLGESQKVNGPITLGLECPICHNKWNLRIASPQATRAKFGKRQRKCPNSSCQKLVEPSVTDLSWADGYVTSAVLEISDELTNSIKRKMEEQYQVSPLVVHFNLDKPKPGQTLKTTEKEALKDPDQLNQVAEELAKHLQTLEKCGVTSHLIFRGYADSSASCLYNERLSERRVEWLIEKLGKRLRSRFNLELGQVTRHACGKFFADDKRPAKDRWKDRAVIIELDVTEESTKKTKDEPERFSIIDQLSKSEGKPEPRSWSIVRNWKFGSYEHKKVWDKAEHAWLQEEGLEEEYIGPISKTDTQTVWNYPIYIFYTPTKPIEEESEEVYVDEVLKRRNLDYTTNARAGEITFIEAPPELAEVRITYVGYGEREPGHPTKGSILEEGRETRVGY